MSLQKPRTLLTKTRLLAVVLFMGLTQVVMAQETWEKEGEGEIKDLTIEFTKERQLILPRANRYFEKVPPRPFEPIVPAITYEFSTYSYTSPNYVPVIRPLRIRQEELPKVYGNYISAGIGNLTSFMVDGSVATKRDKVKMAGADFFWRSFGKGPVDGDNSAQSDTRISLFGKTATDGAFLGGDLNYVNQRGYFYGYAPGSDPDRDKIKQVYETLSAHLSIENRKPGDIAYRLNAGYSQMQDAFVSSEREFSVNLLAKYKTKTQSQFLLGFDAWFIRREDSLFSQPRNLVQLRPAYEFKAGDKLTLTAGVNVAFTNESGQGTGASIPAVNFYPNLVADYRVNEQVSVYAKLTGNLDKVSLHTLAAENFWLGSNNPMLHTNRSLELDAGVSAAANKLRGRIGVSYARLNQLYFYRADRSSFDLAGTPIGISFDRFQLDYDNTFRFNPYVEGSYTFADLLTATLRADYFQYSTATLAEAWHRPTYRGDFRVQYNLFNKIHLQAGLLFQGGMKAEEPGTGVVKTLSAAVDLNLKARYFISRQLSAFVQLDNLLANQYPIYFNYPSRGFQALVGASWSFSR
jgi:hypothetical protein